MMAILLSRGIECTKVSGTDGAWSLTIESGKVSEAVDILKRFGYPRDQFDNLGTLFQKSGLVSSPSEERIRFMFGLSQAVSETLTNIDGVLTARVHIVLRDNDPLADTKSPASASVFIKYRRGSGVDAMSSQIKRLVTNSIEGLEYDKVSVVFVPSDMNEITNAMAAAELEADRANDLRNLILFTMFGILLLGILGVGGYWFYQNKDSLMAKSKTPDEGGEKK